MAVLRSCYRCHQPLPPRGFQPVTVDADGTYRQWTPERAAYFARFGQTAHVVFLCPTCDALEPADTGGEEDTLTQRTDLVTVQEATQRTGVAPATVQRWLRDGRLPGVPDRRGTLVSVQRLRALTTAPPPPSPRWHPRELPDDDALYVPPDEAAHLASVPPTRVRHWAQTGTIASRASAQGRLVRLDDVQALAAQGRGTTPADAAGTEGE